MPQHQSAIKRERQNAKRRERNQAQRSKLRTLINKVLESSDKEEAQDFLKEATSYVDKMAAKGLLHDNNAARKKARMTKHVNNL